MYDLNRQTGRTHRMVQEAVKLATDQSRRVCIVVATAVEVRRLQAYLRSNHIHVANQIRVIPHSAQTVDLHMMQVWGHNGPVLADHHALERYLDTREPLAYRELQRWNMHPTPVPPGDAETGELEALVEFARSAKTAWDSLPELSDGKHLLGEALMELADKIREEAEPHEAEAALNRVWPDPQTPPPGKEAQE